MNFNYDIMNRVSVFFINCVFLHFKKKIKKNFVYLFFYIKEINILNHIKKNIFNKDISILSSILINRFIKLNNILWKKKFINKINSNKVILVESFINHSGYTISNSIIALFLKKKFHLEILGIVKKGDHVAKEIFKSYGIDKCIIYPEANIFQRIKYTIIGLKILKKNTTIKDFSKIKYLKTDLGLTAYDSYIRYTGNPSLKNVNSELFYFLTDGIHACIFFNNLIKKNKIRYSVQAETAFLPSNTLFQMSLNKKIEIFSRLGVNNFAVRRYTDSKQKYDYRDKISKKIFNEIYRNNKKLCIKNFTKIQNEKIKTGKFGIDVRVQHKRKIRPIINRSDLIKRLDWDNKKIGVIFMHHLIDKNFHSGPRKCFSDNYSWSKFILQQLPNIKNVNWIIKPHPTEIYYGSKKDLKTEIEYLDKNFKHIKLFPEDLSQISLLNIADYAISSNGSVGIEYPANGIPSIFIENSYFTHMNFLKKYNKSNNFLKAIKNLNKIKKPTKNTINKSKVFFYARFNLFDNNCSLVPSHNISRDFNKNKFWIKNIEMIKKFRFEEDEFYQMLGLQLKYKLRHTVNFNKIKITKKIYNDFN